MYRRSWMVFGATRGVTINENGRHMLKHAPRCLDCTSAFNQSQHRQNVGWLQIVDWPRADMREDLFASHSIT